MAPLYETTSARGRVRVGLIVLVACVVLASSIGAVRAEVESPWDGELEGTVHAYDDDSASGWGFADFDPGSNNFIYKSYVYAIAQIGDRVYMGGQFRKVTDGNVEYDQPYLAAFDANTGEWIPEFAPAIDWSVFALAGSPDGTRLFVGGEFSDAGAPGTAAFAALDPITGAVDESFDVTVTREWSNNAPRVHAFDVEGDWLYIGGTFSHVEGNGSKVQSSRLARVSATDGTADTTWRPQISGGSVWEIEASPAGDRVYTGGTFITVGGTASQGFAIVDTTAGALLPGFPTDFGVTNFPAGSGYVFAATIVENGDVFWAGGQKHNLVIADRDTFAVDRTFQTNAFGSNNGRGGDFQDMALAGDVLFAGCHCWGRVREPGVNWQRDVRSVIAFDAATGDHLDWYAPDMGGADGAWALHIAHDDCLWIGSDIWYSGNTQTSGLVRHCPIGAPAPPDETGPSAPGGLAAQVNGSDVALSWTRSLDDSGAVTYSILRNGAEVGTTGGTGFVDAAPAGPHTYEIVASDPAGNPPLAVPAISAIVGDDPPPPPPDGPPAVPVGLAAQTDGVDVTLSWDAVLEAASYLVYRDGAYIGWSPTPGFVDAGPGDGVYEYQLRAVNGHGRSDKTAAVSISVGAPDMTPPATPIGLTASVVGGDVHLDWDAVETAFSYLVYRNGAYLGWSPTAGYIDAAVTPGLTYSYQLRAVNEWGRSDRTAAVLITP